jgi:hypothetical protein
LPQ